MDSVKNFKFHKSSSEWNGIEIFPFFSEDNRGSFLKIYEQTVYKEFGIEFHVNEVFISHSQKNVIRGIHFQKKNPQAKVITVVKGEVWDVIVDLRPESPSFAVWQSYELSDKNNNAIYVPAGFGHGFLSQSEDTVVLYLCDGYYDKSADTGIRFDDPDLKIEWPLDDIVQSIHSERDLELMSLKNYINNPIMGI